MTKIAIMQPYFFPYLGYFALIKNVDRWIVFDMSQYTPKTWINRNRIQKPYKEKNWQYITVPLINSSINIKIYEVKILDIIKIKVKILSQLQHYKKHAPFYHEVISIINKTFDNTYSNYLVDLNIQSLKHICEYLSIPFHYTICSKGKFNFKNIKSPDDWAYEITRQLHCSTYINPISGRELFNKDKFQQANISLQFLCSPQQSLTYKTFPYIFIESLSILDVLMFNSKEEVQCMLNQFTIINSLNV